MFGRNGRFDMKLKVAYLCCGLVAKVLPCVTATVILQNSDRLTGEIEKLESKRLVLATAYAGVIEIDWSMVQSISSDQALQFSMNNGMVLTGTVEVAEQGMQTSAATGTFISEIPHSFPLPAELLTYRSQVGAAYSLFSPLPTTRESAGMLMTVALACRDRTGPVWFCLWL